MPTMHNDQWRRPYPVDNNCEPDLPIGEGGDDGRPVKFILEIDFPALSTGVVSQSLAEELSLFRFEEACGFRAVGQKEKASCAHDNGSDTLNEENSPPASKIGNAIHLLQPKCQKTGEGTRHGSGTYDGLVVIIK